MDRIKQFGIWLLLVIVFYLFTNGLIYLWLHGEELGMKIYNMTHKEEVINEAKY